jgi:spore germination cell wall hydrolase CwlJ-like protein
LKRQSRGKGLRALGQAAALVAAALAVCAAPLQAQAQQFELASIDGPMLRGTLAGAEDTVPAPTVAAPPALTTAVLKAYIARRLGQKGFDMFGNAPQPSPAPRQLTSAMVTAYANVHFENAALNAIDNAATAVPLGETFTFEPTSKATIRNVTSSSITDSVLARYIARGYVPTVKRVQTANHERRCLSMAIYNEARGESDNGQWAVANVIINRAMSKRFPSTMCGVVYQNADEGRYRCQFTFACDGRAERIAEPAAWAKAKRIAAAAFAEFQRGKRPGIVPRSALYYHTRAVSPDWAGFREVAEIGAHVFYAPM